jgi:hypothetical protein
MYGKNLMGSYKDKISYEERWNVIHYIRSLQAKELKLEYNQEINTLNSIDRPAGKDYLAMNSTDEMDMEHKDDHSHAEGAGEHGEAVKSQGENHDH